MDIKSIKETIEGRELALYAANNGRFYGSIIEPTIENMQRKKARGVYDEAKAAKAFYNVATEAAKLYFNDFGSRGGKWYEMFSTADRWSAAAELLEFFTENIEG